VLFLNTANFEPETLQGRILERFQQVWETEFWNRSFAGVVSLGLQEPAPLPQEATTLDWATGRIVGLESRYVLARPRFPVDGESLGRRGDLELFRTSGPVRLAFATEGVDAEGRVRDLAAFDGWAPAREVRVTVSTGPGIVRAGTLVPNAGAGAHIGRQTAKRAFGQGEAQIELTLPPPPFRVEVVVSSPDTLVEFDVGRS
jgi:hypothetical protein